MRDLLMTVVAVLLTTASVFSQAPAKPAPAQPAKPAATQPATPGAAAAPAAPPSEAFTYSADGRRDPFTSLIGTGGADSRATASGHAEGAAGLTVSDISVRGILQSRTELIAMIQGPDNKTYIVHKGDKLLDGTIKSITPQGLIVIQDVNDPLSLVKQREVSKLLRSLEGAKE